MSFLFPDIPEDDSEDLSDAEVEAALPTEDITDLIAKLSKHIRENPGEQVSDHELRRRKPHLYWRVKIQQPEDKSTALVFVADWLRGTS